MNHHIPTYLAQSVYDIDYNKLYANGKRVILFDLDNTLAPYDDSTPTDKQLELNKKLKEIGFRIYILSNNHQKRTKLYTTTFLVDGYLVLARKPFVYKIKPFLKKENIEITNTILIGDQLLTDIKCANKLGLDSVLVKSISRKSEKWYTRINRLREKRVINNIAKVDKEKANAIAKIIGERNDSNE